MNTNNIILIGFMGVGKGTVARALVKKSDYFAVDTDDLIESLENRKIKNIFNEDGEAYFRALEKKCALWCETNLTNTIISTGGGFYKQENLANIGTIIYLESSFDSIIQGIYNAPNAKKKLKKRPLLQDLDAAKKLFLQRTQEYASVAHITISIQNKPIEKVVEEIFQNIHNNL